MSHAANKQDIECCDGEVRLRLTGILNGESAAALRPRLEAIVASTARLVVLDLGDLRSIDGSGVGAVAWLFKRLAGGRRRLILSGAAGQPLALLKELGLTRLLGVEPPSRRRFGFARLFGAPAFGVGA